MPRGWFGCKLYGYGIIVPAMERGVRNRRAVIGTQAQACATIMLLACSPCAFALNPSLDINQYAHTAWTARDGIFKGIINAIAQTPDGYLWLGTEFGLLRFDGVRSVPWRAPAGEPLPSSDIRSLLAARDGRIWIGTRGGLASWKDGRLTHYPELAGQDVIALLEDRDGSVWAGGSAAPTGRLCVIHGGRAHCYGADGSFGRSVGHLFEDGGGNLWAGTQAGVWRWKPGPPKLYPMAEMPRDLSEGDNGALLVATQTGIRRLVGGSVEAYTLPGAGRELNSFHLLRDRKGSLWIGTNDRGLLHSHQGRTDIFGRSEGLSSDLVLGFFEDHEGNIWVATRDGLDRFRDFSISTISVKQGMSDDRVQSVLAAKDGSVWFGTPDGLNRWIDGRITTYRKRNSGLPDDAVESLFQDDRGRMWVSTSRGIASFEDGRFIPVDGVRGRYVYSIAGDSAGNLWVGHQDEGLFRFVEGSLVEQIPWDKLGRQSPALVLLGDSVQGGLWLGFRNGGVTYFKDGQVRASYAGINGLADGFVSGLQLDPDGTLWAATQGGLSRVKNGRVATLTSRNGLPCDTVHWAVEDDDHSFWLYMACGLVRIARPELDAWASDPKRTVKATVFDESDGVRSHSVPAGYSPRVAKSADGKLWFLPFDGVSVLDPRHIPFNKLPPPVHVEEVKVDGKDWDASQGWRLPALTRDLEIHYTALSFVAPEKNRFKYKLEGRDSDWKDAGNERKASYTDLPPRNYRFRVMASNNNGVWNEAGDSLDFSIAPAYYQTTWFRVSLAGAFFVLLWGLYQYRLYQVAREFNANLEGRVDERLRVARDLHDTLLQSFHGLLPRFQAAYNLLPKRTEDAKQVLETAIDDAARAITEARDAVQDMRSSTVIVNDLAKAVEAVGLELAAHQRDAHGDAPSFSLEVEGSPQDLHPILRDEIYRISSEALRNAFHHARARKIEVEIRYDARQLRVRVRDDGTGIDAGLLEKQGRPGHFGLRGMRERATGVGGRLEVWSESGAGTEIELSIPGSIAYGPPSAHGFWGRFRKKPEPTHEQPS